MKKSIMFFLGISVLLLLTVSSSFASDADVVFDTLASRAGTVGAGLRQSGYLIAGFGLIMFSVLAIFNKISWKTFAYIAVSCFVLSITAAIINYISNDTSSGSVRYTGSGSKIKFDDGNGGAPVPTGDVTVMSVKIKKD